MRKIKIGDVKIQARRGEEEEERRGNKMKIIYERIDTPISSYLPS